MVTHRRKRRMKATTGGWYKTKSSADWWAKRLRAKGCTVTRTNLSAKQRPYKYSLRVKCPRGVPYG